MEKMLGEYFDKKFQQLSLGSIDSVGPNGCVLVYTDSLNNDSITEEVVKKTMSVGGMSIIFLGSRAENFYRKFDELATKIDCDNLPQLSWSIDPSGKAINSLFRPTRWSDYSGHRDIYVIGSTEDTFHLKKYLEKIKNQDSDTLPTPLSESNVSGSVMPLIGTPEERFRESKNSWIDMGFDELRKYLGSNFLSYYDPVADLTYVTETQIEKISEDTIKVVSTMNYPDGKIISDEVLVERAS